MKRKVIQLAHKTLVVSLPSKWAKNYGVKKGAELEVEDRGQQIIFSTSTSSNFEKAKIDATNMNPEALKRWVLSSLHKTGYNEIEIFYKNPTIIEVIQNTIKELLIGFAIVEQRSNSCVIRVVAEEQEKEFDSILRRAFLVTKSMGEGIYSCVKNKDPSGLKNLLVLEKTNNQLTNFCERILNKKGYKDDRKRSFAYVVAWNLEKVCDDYANVCKLLMEEPKTSSQTLEMIKKANHYFAKYYKLFYEFDMNKLSELQKGKNEFGKKTLIMLRRASPSEAMILCKLNDFIEKTSDFSASFIALNMEEAKTS